MARRYKIVPIKDSHLWGFLGSCTIVWAKCSKTGEQTDVREVCVAQRKTGVVNDKTCVIYEREEESK